MKKIDWDVFNLNKLDILLLNNLFKTVMLVSLMSTTVACGKKAQTSAKTAPPSQSISAITVKLQSVTSGKISDFNDFVGTLEAKQKVSLKPQISGRIEKILVSQGQRVKKGDPIIQLRPEQNQAQVEAAKDYLRDGLTVKGRVVWSEKPGILIFSTEVTRLGGQSFVFVADKTPSGEVVKQTPIKVGKTEGSSYQVEQGIKPGDKIAVSNILKLKNGTPIKPET